MSLAQTVANDQSLQADFHQFLQLVDAAERLVDLQAAQEKEDEAYRLRDRVIATISQRYGKTTAEAESAFDTVADEMADDWL